MYFHFFFLGYNPNFSNTLLLGDGKLSFSAIFEPLNKLGTCEVDMFKLFLRTIILAKQFSEIKHDKSKCCI